MQPNGCGNVTSPDRLKSVTQEQAKGLLHSAPSPQTHCQLQPSVGQTIAFCGLQLMSHGPLARGSRARDERPASSRTIDDRFLSSVVSPIGERTFFQRCQAAKQSVSRCPPAFYNVP